MACRAQDAAGARKGTDAPARPDRPRAPRAAVGAHREELRLRHHRGPAYAGRAVRWPAPAAGAALHARPGLGAGLPELLVHGRPHRRHDRAPGAPRHHVRGHLARAAGRDPALSSTHGLAVQMGVVECERLQLRLRREFHTGRKAREQGHLQLRHAALRMGRAARHQRFLQGRRRPDLPHLLHLPARRGGDDGHLQPARPHAQGSRRRPGRGHGLGAPP